MQNNTRDVKQQPGKAFTEFYSRAWGLISQDKNLSKSCFLSLCLCLCASGVQAVINTMCGFGVQTQNYLEANKSIYPVGCADRAVMWIESHLLLVGALTLGLALPQVTTHMHLLNAGCALIGSSSLRLVTSDISALKLLQSSLKQAHTHKSIHASTGG